MITLTNSDLIFVFMQDIQSGLRKNPMEMADQFVSYLLKQNYISQATEPMFRYAHQYE